MAYELSIQRYRHWYAKLLRFYSKPYQERFGEGMKQTFHDLLREYAKENRGLFRRTSWIFVETSIGIIKEYLTFRHMQHTPILRLILVTVCILLIPLVAMRFTSEVHWTLFDFVFAGTLIFGTGLAYQLITRKTSVTMYRAGVSVALAAAFLLVWINGAVGMIGNEDNPINLMYLGVIAIATIGAFMARLKAPGMARAMFAAGVAQMLVPVIAFVIAKPQVTTEPPGIVGVLGLNAVFALMFIGSGLLLREAAQKRG